MSPFCPDTEKYRVVDAVAEKLNQMAAQNEKILDQTITDIVTVNGVRITLEDGSWGLVRASSNKPGLVVVVESPVSDTQMRAMFSFLDGLLSVYDEVGEYDQKL
jgi:phosphomannomutase/phosphoglucomutase